jgi:hypothetical protein
MLVGIPSATMPAVQPRPLTLDDVPDELLAEVGLSRGCAPGASYRCSDPGAFLVPLAEVVGPARKLNREALRSFLCAVRDGIARPPVVVFREPGAAPRRCSTGCIGGGRPRRLGSARSPARSQTAMTRNCATAIPARSVTAG